MASRSGPSRTLLHPGNSARSALCPGTACASKGTPASGNLACSHGRRCARCCKIDQQHGQLTDEKCAVTAHNERVSDWKRASQCKPEIYAESFISGQVCCWSFPDFSREYAAIDIGSPTDYTSQDVCGTANAVPCRQAYSCKLREYTQYAVKPAAQNLEESPGSSSSLLVECGT